MRDIAKQLFVDHDGQPRLVLSAVVFVDSLGTSAASVAPDASVRLVNLHRAITGAAARSTFDHVGMLQYTTWFTDNVVAALPIAAHQDTESALRYAVTMAAEFSVGLLEHAILSRGGVSLGAIYIDDRFAFGPGLISAHDLEVAADKPRVLVDPRVAELLQDPTELDVESLDAGLAQPTAPLRDGELLYANHFDVAFSGRSVNQRAELALMLRAGLRKGLAQAAGSARHEAKWNWAVDLFDSSVRRYGIDLAP